MKKIKKVLTLVAAIALSIALLSCRSNRVLVDSHLTVEKIEMKLGEPLEEGLFYDELPFKSYSFIAKDVELQVLVIYRDGRAVVMQYLTPIKFSMSIEERFVSRENMRKGAEHLEFPDNVAQEILETLFKGQKFEETGPSGDQWITQGGYKAALRKKEGRLTVTSIRDMEYINQLNRKQKMEQSGSAPDGTAQ